MEYVVERIDSIDQLSSIRDEWNDLLQRSETNIIFLTLECILSWWKCFGKGKELFVLLVKNDEKLVAIAPLMITTLNLGIKIKKIEFISTAFPNYCDFIISNECEDKRVVLRNIYDYLLKEKDSWDIISLEEIPEASSTLTYSEEILKNSDIFFSIFLDDICPTLIFEGSQRGEIEKKLNKRSIRRKLKCLNEAGSIEYDYCKDISEAIILLDVFFQQHINRWKPTSTPSIFEDERYKALYRELMKSLLPKGWVDLSFLRFDEKPVAFQFGFMYNNRYEGYTSSYDTSYATYSPGMILFKFNIENYLSKNFREFDLGRGDGSYKSRFSNKVRKNFKIRFYQNRLFFVLDTTWEKTKEEIMKHDGLSQILSESRDKTNKFYMDLFHKR